jgi:hypothetical protein
MFDRQHTRPVHPVTMANRHAAKAAFRASQAEQKIAAAQAKRDRKAAKRAAQLREDEHV